MLRSSETAEAAHRTRVLPSARLIRIVSGSTAPRVRSSGPADRPIVESFLHEHGAEHVARLGELVDARDYPALLAESEGDLLGLLTYDTAGERCEILTLHTTQQRRGVGTALIEEVERVASAEGCRELWLITTNDNVDALRFYQRRGFRFSKLHPGAVDRSRESLKPEIPEAGEYGIAIRDELELQKEL
jgi:GNAT superfamily N-acetyltransferase